MSTSDEKSLVTFSVEETFLADLQSLPWQHSIQEWNDLGVKLLDVKRGIGRHPIVFVESGRHRFVIKELGIDVCFKEIDSFRELLRRGVHTLVPVGCVVREEEPIEVETQVGRSYVRNLVGHTVTLLVERVLPDSQLYRRAFRFENRKRIWDAIVDLFVNLHLHGVLWGDASLANVLVKFLRVEIPHIGKKVELKAFLADAETIEIHDTISDSLRKTDLEYFIDSMEWINQDLLAEGILRDPLDTQEDIEYIRESYKTKHAAGQRLLEFENRTGLNVQQLLGKLSVPVEVDLLQKHIEEHKWYVSEKRHREVDIKEAAKRWHDEIFVPICALFQEEDVSRFLPGKTASELYVEIMTHKYYMSKEQGKDVGMGIATRDYVDRFGTAGPIASFWIAFYRKMAKIFDFSESGFPGIPV